MHIEIERPNPRIVSMAITAHDWQLYTYDDGLTERCAHAAMMMNAEFERLVNAGVGPAHVFRGMQRVMAHYADLGALDTEPQWLLDQMINRVYGDAGWAL